MSNSTSQTRALQADSRDTVRRNKSVAWAYFATFAHGRLDRCRELINADSVYWHNAAVGDRRVAVSLDGWLDDVVKLVDRHGATPWQADHLHVVNFFGAGNQIVVEIHNDSPWPLGEATSTPYDMVYLFVVVVDDGKITSLREYADGFYLVSLLAEGSTPVPTADWWDLASLVAGAERRVQSDTCRGCGYIHPVDTTTTSSSPAVSTRNAAIVLDHFRSIEEGRGEDASALLSATGGFWRANRAGGMARRAISIEAWRRELQAIVDRRLPIPWTTAPVVNCVAEGDQVMLEIHNISEFGADARSDGAYDMVYAWVLTVRDGLITDVREYPDGIYGATMLREWYPEEKSSFVPIDTLGELPPYTLPSGICVSCNKHHLLFPTLAAP